MDLCQRRMTNRVLDLLAVRRDSFFLWREGISSVILREVRLEVVRLA